MRIISALAIVGALGAPVLAQRVEHVARVTASPDANGGMHAIGPRYISLSELRYDHDAQVDVLDLESRSVVTMSIRRALLEKDFGTRDALGPRGPEGELVTFDAGRAGLHLADDMLLTRRRHWYAELDRKTDAVVRSTSLGTLDDRHELYFIGTDVARGAVWFYVERYGAGRTKDYGRRAGPESVVFRRLDLATLALTDAATVKLPARRMKNGYEDRVSVHTAPDFSRFALVEYDEDAFHTRPAASVYFVDPRTGTSFAVPALDTTYGVAFSPDGAYAFLASAQVKKLARVDLVKHRVDKTVASPYLAHHAIVSPDGGQLFVIASSERFTVYDLPSLAHRRDIEHDAATREAARYLFDSGLPSLDGKYFVIEESMPMGTIVIGPGAPPRPPQVFLIARLRD